MPARGPASSKVEDPRSALTPSAIHDLPDQLDVVGNIVANQMGDWGGLRNLRTCGVGRVALAETINGLYKAEVIHRRGPWRSFEAVEFATLEWGGPSLQISTGARGSRVPVMISEAMSAKNIDFLLGAGCSSLMKGDKELGISTMAPLAKEFCRETLDARASGF